jgi:signal transduction histidine kinase
MRIDRFYGRTAIRLALAFSALFVLSMLALFAILYFSLTQSLETRLRQRVMETQDALARIDREQGFDDLVAVVASEAASVRDADSIFLLLDAEGEPVVGNIQKADQFQGWRILDRAQFPAIQDIGNPDDRFYAMWSHVEHGQMLVGANNRVIIETRNTLFRALLWGIAFGIVIPALVGTHLALRAQRRIDVLASTLSAVAAGQMGERVPTFGARDDLDHVARQINRTLDQLQRLIRSVNETSSDIAHDLKHPIGRLRQRLDVARGNAQSVAEFHHVICGALTEIDTIVETFEALLRITQIEAGAGRQRFTRVDLKALLSNIADIYGPVIEDEGRRFECDLDRAPAAIIAGDRELLTQLFANIIENSIHHCPAGATISIALSARDDMAVARLCDTGPGIPEAERKKVFQRLYRLEKSRSRPGNGLGLSLVAAIAELHGAKIELGDCRPGLCVTVAFPLPSEQLYVVADNGSPVKACLEAPRLIAPRSV